MGMKEVAGVLLVLVSMAGLVFWSTPQDGGVAAVGGPRVAPTELISVVRTMAWAEEVDDAQRLIEQERESHNPLTPEWLVAVSWLARGAGFAERWDVAEQYAREAFDGSVALLDKRPLDADAEPHLPIALGAAIEVLGLAQDADGDRLAARTFLRTQHARFDGTSIERRLQKNLLLLSLEGEPFPDLEVEHHLGPAPPSSASLHGKVVVAFFWAHWCPDCKVQLPILQTLYERYQDRGLVIIGPTQLWGYRSRGDTATPEQELDYLNGAYQERHPIPSWMSVPVSAENFSRFGVSTTPTLVLIDREGIVQLYNPGTLDYDELAAHVERLLG